MDFGLDKYCERKKILWMDLDAVEIDDFGLIRFWTNFGPHIFFPLDRIRKIANRKIKPKEYPSFIIKETNFVVIIGKKINFC